MYLKQIGEIIITNENLNSYDSTTDCQLVINRTMLTHNTKMLPNKLQLILPILNLFLVLFSTSGDAQCGNTQVTCNQLTYYVKCDIAGLDTEIIQQKIYDCALNFGDDEMYISIETGGAGVTLNLTFPDNVETLYISNQFPEPVTVETSVVNMHLKRIDFYNLEVFINHNDFFSYFPSLEYFYADIIGSERMPIFSQNLKLTEIDVSVSMIRNESSRVITREMTGGLSYLKYFYWYDGGVTEIASDAFYGLISLKNIGLFGNDIHELYDCTFSDSETLLYMELASNDVRKVGEYTFIGLDGMESISLDHNPSFPLNTLTLAKSIKRFYLNFHDPSLIKAQFFQQFPNINFISFASIPFDCSCKYEWISKLKSDFNINLQLDTLTFCPGQPGMQVDDSSLYTNCSNSVTYQCFNHSIVCEEENWLRVDSGNSCICTYPPERRLYNETSFVCSDVNECEDGSTVCQGNCTNTIGSYTCSCRDGYVNFNETTCSDVNECMTANGGCEQNCTNTVGSYTCSCSEGYVNFNDTTCSDVNECITANGGCEQNCTNTVGSYTCSCSEGYVNFNETTCSDVNECMTVNGGCQQNCTNTFGSHTCSCSEGYSISLSNSNNCDLIIGAIQSPRILNLTELEFSFLVLAIIAVFLILLFTIGLILACVFFKMRSHNLKPDSKPTIAQLDDVKAEKGIVLENPMSQYEVTPLETKKLDGGIDESLAPKEGTETLTSELAVV